MNSPVIFHTSATSGLPVTSAYLLTIIWSCLSSNPYLPIYPVLYIPVHLLCLPAFCYVYETPVLFPGYTSLPNLSFGPHLDQIDLDLKWTWTCSFTGWLSPRAVCPNLLFTRLSSKEIDNCNAPDAYAVFSDCLVVDHNLKPPLITK